MTDKKLSKCDTELLESITKSDQEDGQENDQEDGQENYFLGYISLKVL